MRAKPTIRAVLALLLFSLALTGRPEDYAVKIAPLIDPAKLATLGERGANPRVQKHVAQRRNFFWPMSQLARIGRKREHDRTNHEPLAAVESLGLNIEN
jgi:hypothetical protein